MTEGLKATKKLKRDKGSNPSVAAALPRRATSPDSGEADYLTALLVGLHQTGSFFAEYAFGKDYKFTWLPCVRRAVGRA